MASLQTSAVRDGDEWVLNGQKVWTSGAQYSDYGAILARTDPTKPKHEGISMFIVDMHAPGVTVRPLKVATGHSPFNEVFFDNVRLPADAIIGEDNKGWAAAVVMLRHERIAIGTMGASRSSPLAFDSLRDLAAGLGRTSDQGVRRELAELYAQGRAMQLFALLLRQETLAGRLPGARGSIAKLAGSELSRYAGNVAADVLGDQLAGFDSEELHAVTTSIVAAPGNSIAGRHRRDPAQHHRRARARTGQGPGSRPGDPVQPAAGRHAAPELRTAREPGSMALILTDEEQALADSVRKFVADRSPLTSLRQLMASGQPYDPDVWKQMTAQLGLAGLNIPEECGGAGAGVAALSVALTELGAGLVASPLLGRRARRRGTAAAGRRRGQQRAAAADRRGRDHRDAGADQRHAAAT